MNSLAELNGAIQSAALEAQRVMKPGAVGMASIERILELSELLERRLVLLMLAASIRHVDAQSAEARKCAETGGAR